MINKILSLTILIILSASINKNKFINELEKDIPYLKNLYLDIHQNPEISLMEKVTAQKLANELKKVGLDCYRKFWRLWNCWNSKKW